MSPDFLQSETWMAVLDILNDRLNDVDSFQDQIDSFYDSMLSEIFKEMDDYIQYKYVNHNW